MNWCLDCILTWGDLRSARPAGFRPPYVPNMGPQTAPGTSTWALGTSTWALQTALRSQDTSKRPSRAILDQFWTPPGGPGGPKTL